MNRNRTGRYLLGAAVWVLCFAVGLCGENLPATSTPGQDTRGGHWPAAAESYLRLAEQIETHLRQQVLDKWFPRCVDQQHGGFLPNFREDWSPGTDNHKTIVFQARQTWVAAEVAKRYPDLRQQYLAYARHGLEFLERVMWDAECGGFFWGLDSTGKIGPRYAAEKHAYGISFGIYAAANVYQAGGERRALDLAQRGFRWLEQHAHDEVNGGYFEALTREGKPILQPPTANKTRDLIGTVYGYKSMNSHIHLLEAVTALYRVWPDQAVEKRLRELLQIVTDKIYVDPGCLNQFFTPDWRPLPEHDSFGHDIETAFLLVEAAAALKQPDDPKVWRVARRLVDHALQWGWDARHGGFYDRGVAFGPACGKEKIWWTQAEGLNALVLMHYRFEHRRGEQSALDTAAQTHAATPHSSSAAQRQPAPASAGTLTYWNALLAQWEWIIRFQHDAKHGEWFAVVSHDGAAAPNQDKATVWKACYHNGRALMHTADLLREMAGARRR